MNKINIISHRGGFLPEGSISTISQYEIPENTLEAFERAFQNGWGVETDVRLTADGGLVIIHDEDIKRFSDKDGIINQMTTTQISDVYCKTNPQFKIPTLDELCELAIKYTKNGQAPFIAFQVKRGSNHDSGLAVGRAVAQRIQRHGLKKSILFDATLEEAQTLHQEFPHLNLSVSVGENNYNPTIYTPNQVLIKKFTSVYTSVWADEWKIPGSIYNEELFKKLRAAYEGRIDVISPELHYNENHPLSKDLAKLKSLWQEIISWWIVNGICTDYPTQLKLFCI